MNGDNFGCLNNGGLGQTSFFNLFFAQKIFVARDYFVNLRSNSHGDNIIMDFIEGIIRDNYYGSLFKGGKISEREGNKDNISPIKGHYKCYLPGYSRNQRSFPRPSEEKYHQGGFLEAGVDPEVIFFVPRFLSEKFLSQPFLTYLFALSSAHQNIPRLIFSVKENRYRLPRPRKRFPKTADLALFLPLPCGMF